MRKVSENGLVVSHSLDRATQGNPSSTARNKQRPMLFNDVVMFGWPQRLIENESMIINQERPHTQKKTDVFPIQGQQSQHHNRSQHITLINVSQCYNIHQQTT